MGVPRCTRISGKCGARFFACMQTSSFVLQKTCRRRAKPHAVVIHDPQCWVYRIMAPVYQRHGIRPNRRLFTFERPERPCPPGVPKPTSVPFTTLPKETESEKKYGNAKGETKVQRHGKNRPLRVFWRSNNRSTGPSPHAAPCRIPAQIKQENAQLRITAAYLNTQIRLKMVERTKGRLHNYTAGGGLDCNMPRFRLL